MSKHDEAVEKLLERFQIDTLEAVDGKTMPKLSPFIQHIRDAGWLHKSEIELDEGKIANVIHKSDHPWYSNCVESKNAKFYAHEIAQAGIKKLGNEARG